MHGNYSQSLGDHGGRAKVCEVRKFGKAHGVRALHTPRHATERRGYSCGYRKQERGSTPALMAGDDDGELNTNPPTPCQ